MIKFSDFLSISVFWLDWPFAATAGFRLGLSISCATDFERLKGFVAVASVRYGAFMKTGTTGLLVFGRVRAGFGFEGNFDSAWPGLVVDNLRGCSFAVTWGPTERLADDNTYDADELGRLEPKLAWDINICAFANNSSTAFKSFSKFENFWFNEKYKLWIFKIKILLPSSPFSSVSDLLFAFSSSCSFGSSWAIFLKSKFQSYNKKKTRTN